MMDGTLRWLVSPLFALDSKIDMGLNKEFSIAKHGRLKIATLDVPAFLERSSLMPKKQVTGAHISPFQIENQSWRRPLNLLS